MDAQITLARGDIERHAANQSRAWQRQVAMDRIDLLAKEAALHHRDDALIDTLGIAAANAARVHARVDGEPSDISRENGAAVMAQSRILSAAIQARLSNGNVTEAKALLDRTRDLLGPASTIVLSAQIEATRQPAPGEATAASSAAGPSTEINPYSSESRAALIAPPALAPGATSSVARVVGSAASRIVPLASGAASSALGALPLILTPTNFQGGVIELGNGLRAQWRPGQRTAKIERRVNDGLFGSGIVADWEELPVSATYEAGPDRRPTLFVDPKGLERAIGATAAGMVLGKSTPPPTFQPLPASKPSIYEIRIADSVNGGQTTTFREATHEEIERLCPNYPMIQGVGLRAAAEVKGFGMQRGRIVHRLAENELKIIRSAEMLREIGVVEMSPEIALRKGVDLSFYRAKGSSVLDVLEVYGHGSEKRACAYDFKTGMAVFPDATAVRYADEIGKYVKKKFDVMPVHISVVPVYLP